jgi:hypothetical protein
MRHELPSPVQRHGPWSRVPLEAWMPVCVYSVLVLTCVLVWALWKADSTFKVSYRPCIKNDKVPQRAVDP